MLRGSQCRELWLIFVVKVLESYSYFSMSLIYVVLLTDSFGVGDIAAGGSYGLWGMLTVAWGVVLGPVIDRLGATAAAPGTTQPASKSSDTLLQSPRETRLRTQSSAHPHCPPSASTCSACPSSNRRAWTPTSGHRINVSPRPQSHKIFSGMCSGDTCSCSAHPLLA